MLDLCPQISFSIYYVAKNVYGVLIAAKPRFIEIVSSADIFSMTFDVNVSIIPSFYTSNKCCKIGFERIFPWKWLGQTGLHSLYIEDEDFLLLFSVRVETDMYKKLVLQNLKIIEIGSDKL